MSRVCLLALVAVCCLAALAEAQPHRNGDFMSMSRSRRTPHGVVRMRGYVGLSRKGGYPMAFAGGYAGARSEDIPAYAAPGASAEEEDAEPEPVQDEEEPQQDDEEEVAPEPVKPARPSRARPSKPAARPPRPSKPSSDDDEEFGPPPSFGTNGKGRGGATAIATSYSNGKGAVANSHAIAYDGAFSGGQYKHKY